ncbi:MULTISPECIES: hypothetical protein [Paenarthrobacter]|uniref:Secreted protein n=1 Tax=Paenarthrobacter ureafaciens TaxID=37931 RepID=A0AAX3ERT9_PAEUR|nr:MULTISPECIES: hypothetical protein [Paenarthrobacter]MDO5867091.1 hypothetical protein [Paenarthrobacter sp. SD-2]MDO5878260.1 hypothetical protein [Paenarthrobacter sp. SD-1]UYV95532.1 hypothetical protein NL395_23190 [Paenarthrobacter ureafaciens]UYW00133.1 hypothetical protein NL394_23575 [Paenarthrobacter ureafaciens]
MPRPRSRRITVSWDVMTFLPVLLSAVRQSSSATDITASTAMPPPVPSLRAPCSWRFLIPSGETRAAWMAFKIERRDVQQGMAAGARTSRTPEKCLAGSAVHG